MKYLRDEIIILESTNVDTVKYNELPMPIITNGRHRRLGVVCVDVQ